MLIGEIPNMIWNLFLMIFMVKVEAFELRCPHSSTRHLRAKLICKDISENQYSCLYDKNRKVYIESCTESANFVRPGQKYIIRGERENTNCSIDMYQPFKFWSNRQTACALRKSSCNELGQEIYDVRSTTNDNTCYCNYKEGYVFLHAPQNPCFCVPSEEDCTCYQLVCDNNKTDPYGHKCDTDDAHYNSECKPLKTRDDNIQYKASPEKIQEKTFSGIPRSKYTLALGIVANVTGSSDHRTEMKADTKMEFDDVLFESEESEFVMDSGQVQAPAVKSENAPAVKSENDILLELGLHSYYPDKILLFDAINVKPPLTKNNLSLASLPWVFVENIITLNVKARDEMIENTLKNIQQRSDSDDMHEDFLENLLRNKNFVTNVVSVNPLDLCIAVFKCSSPLLKQVIASKMFMCRLAIPFCLPETTDNSMQVLVWPLRQIVVETRSIGAVNCPCDVVSFIRLGHRSISKSRLINEIISDQYHHTFFNKDCPLGLSQRWISDGLIEASWYIPSTKSRILQNVTCILNLRGGADKHTKQFAFLSKISTIVVIMVDLKMLRDVKFKEMLSVLYKSGSKVLVALDALEYNMGVLKAESQSFETQYASNLSSTRLKVFSVNRQIRSFSEIKKDMTNGISELVNETQKLSLEERIECLDKTHFKIDENEETYRMTKKKAEQIANLIHKESSSVKEQLLPLQGQPWREWSRNLKTVKKSSLHKTLQEKGKIRKGMLENRQEQSYLCQNLGKFMKTSIESLMHFLPNERQCIIFITWLKIFLDERSRRVLPEYLTKYKNTWLELKTSQNENRDQKVIDRLGLELSNAEYELAEASFGLEHLCREFGQMYEAITECQSLTLNELRELATILPKISAKLLLMGHPFEIMDGDVANVPMLWVKAVLEELKAIIGDKKVLALSVVGIQSSGKSTLLNTMFGLQFAVSAGRCTRGVFMQLVPVSDESQPFDYVMVIDTEGLRAPELAHEKYSHDNELATFVIGLGDITIVNVKGENTTEVRDVLQIVVHAFLRLKLANQRLNLKQKCVFVHQNVSAADAEGKMVQQRQKLVETLNKMTKEASDQENIVDINYFSQVIDFDSERNVWYFSDLWFGDPPMAPANPGYSSGVAAVKKALFFDYTVKRETYLTITDTISRIHDLWTGILKDDFVFSFRNSLELKAYNSMERQCQGLTWKLEKYVLEFIRSEAKSFFISFEDADLEKAVLTALAHLTQEINKMVSSANNDLDSFVEKSTLKDIMIQWTRRKKIRLELLSESLVQKAMVDINKTKEEIRIQRLKVRENTKYELEINELARKLAIGMRGKIPVEIKLEEEFNRMWASWIKQLARKDEVEVEPIKDQIQGLLYDKFLSDVAFLWPQRTKSIVLQYHHFEKLEGTICAQRILKEYFSVHTSLIVLAKEKDDKVRNQAVDIANKIFKKIDTRLSELNSEDVRFNISYVTEILNIIINEIGDFNDHKDNDYKFNLLPPFRAMIVNHVARYITIFFTRLNDRYNLKHSPKAQMEQYKGTAWSLFKNLVESKTEDVIAAGFFREAIIKAVSDHVTELLPIDVQENILVLFSNSKFSLMKDIMVKLANDNKFDDYKSFIQDPSTFARSYVTTLTNETIFETVNGRSKYATLANTRISKIFNQLLKSISTTTTTCTMKGKSDISTWIDTFVQHVSESNTLPLLVDLLVHVQSRNVSDVTNFTQLLTEEMEDIELVVNKGFRKTTSENVKWKENPINKIMNRLWGCEKKCMFCFEPCKNTDKDHIEQGFPHQCVQHRPQGIGGVHWTNTKKLLVEFCNYLVTTNQDYLYGKVGEKERRYYKEYKKDFPGWDIIPSSDVSKYWMWVMCKYPTELSKMHYYEPPNIPLNWYNITKQQAIESISNMS